MRLLLPFAVLAAASCVDRQTRARRSTTAPTAAHRSLGAGAGRLIFYPRADGINDFDQINYDDWSALRYAVCRNVVNPTGSVSSPISCPPRPW